MKTKTPPKNKKTTKKTNNLQKCVDKYLSYDEEIMLADGLEKAFVGIGRKFGSPAFAVYNRSKCLDILVEEGMSPEEAEEFFEFNIAGAYVGENTPAFIELCE
jgi:hypothetical protein